MPSCTPSSVQAANLPKLSFAGAESWKARLGRGAWGRCQAPGCKRCDRDDTGGLLAGSPAKVLQHVGTLRWGVRECSW